MSIYSAHQQLTDDDISNANHYAQLATAQSEDESDDDNVVHTTTEVDVPTEAPEAVVQFRFNLLMSTIERSKVRISLIKSEYIHNSQRQVAQMLRDEGKRAAAWSLAPIDDTNSKAVTAPTSAIKSNEPHTYEVKHIKEEDNHLLLSGNLPETTHVPSGTAVRQNVSNPHIAELLPIYSALLTQAAEHCGRLTLTKSVRPVGTRISCEIGTVQSSLVCGVYVPIIEEEGNDSRGEIVKRQRDTVVIACGYENGNTYLFDVHNGTQLSLDAGDGHSTVPAGEQQLHTAGNGCRVQAIASHPTLPYLFISRRGGGGALTPSDSHGTASGAIEVWHLKYTTISLSHVDGPQLKPTTISSDAISNSTGIVSTIGNNVTSNTTRIVSHKVTTLYHHTGQVHRLAVDPTGSLLVSTSADMTIGLWDMTHTNDEPQEPHVYHKETANKMSPKFLYQQTGHNRTSRNNIWAVTFHPDGTCFITTDFAGMANVWDSRSGERIFSSSPPSDAPVGSSGPYPELATHTGRCTAAAWAPSGLHFCTGGDDGLIHMYCVRSLLTDKDTVSSAPPVHESSKASVRKWKHGRGDAANGKRPPFYGRPCLTIAAHDDTITALHFQETLVTKPQYGSDVGGDYNKDVVAICKTDNVTKKRDTMYLRPVSHWLASTCVDGSVKLWSTIDGTLLRTLLAEYGAQPAARFIFSVPGPGRCGGSHISAGKCEGMNIVVGQRKADWGLWEEKHANSDDTNSSSDILPTTDVSGFTIPPFHFNASLTTAKSVKPTLRRKSTCRSASPIDVKRKGSGSPPHTPLTPHKRSNSNSQQEHLIKSPRLAARSIEKSINDKKQLHDTFDSDSDEDEMERLKRKKHAERK